MKRLAVLFLLTATLASAHEGESLQPHDLWTSWSYDPGILIPLSLIAALYVRGETPSHGISRTQRYCFWLGWLILLVALLSPLHPLGEALFSAHMAQHFIKDYQRKRIMVFLSPGFDPLGSGYNILQSVIAIGSGRFFGKGLGSGTQTQLGFLPEKHTDFIFSVIGEEMGFMWACIVLIAFGVLVWRSFVIATESQDRFGMLIATGIGCLFAFESFMNIGMVIGLLPITGVALPFVSYGGSHMISSLMAIGFLQSVNFRRYIY